MSLKRRQGNCRETTEEYRVPGGGKKALDGQRMRRSEREEEGRYMGNFTNHSFSISSQQVGCRKVKVQQ